MKSLSAMFALSLLAAPATSQPPPCYATGGGMLVADPINPGPFTSGIVRLWVDYCPTTPSLIASLAGAPIGFMDPTITYEHVMFMVSPGVPIFPSTSLFGGELWVGSTGLVAYDAGGVGNITPGGCGGCGYQASYNVGGIWDFTSLAPLIPLGYAFTIQAALWDGSNALLYTTEAVTYWI